MQLLFLLDFDGVLFNSAFEAYQVCEYLVGTDANYRKAVPFDEFMEFRGYLTDAWQFNRLYRKDRLINNFSDLAQVTPDELDWRYAKKFFQSREVLMQDPEWAKLMSPYPFFHQIKGLINNHPELFKIISTRNKASIQRTFEFYGISKIEIWGQEAIRDLGSKVNVATANGWLDDQSYTIYLDDMNSHLEPFQGQVDLCVHAGWGYDASGYESYTQTQAFNLINGFVSIYSDKK